MADRSVRSRVAYVRRRAALAVGAACSFGVVAASCVPDQALNPKAGIGLEEAPEAKSVATVDFAKPVADTVAAGENAILLYEGKDIGVLDLSDARSPKTYGPLTTADRAVAVDYDAERMLAFVVDASGTLSVVNLASASGASIVLSIGVPALAGKVTGLARVGDRLFVLAGTVLQPLTMTFAEGAPSSFAIGAPLTLGRAATQIAAGAGALYVGFANGDVEAWNARGGDAPSKLSTFAGGGELRAVLAKGSKVLVLSKGVGLNVVDFGAPSSPVILKTIEVVSDVSAAKLFGPTLLVGLEKGLTSTIDVTVFAQPTGVTTNKGELPKFFTVVAGNIFMGQPSKGEVRAVPPVVSGVVPALIAKDFPVDGQIPITFSKVIDPASVTAASVVVTCNGQIVAGSPVVSQDHLSVSFRATSALPMGANCTIDLAGVRDAVGSAVAPGTTGSSFPFTTSTAAPAVVSNPGSAYPHTADGKFTDLNGGDAAGGAKFEWYDVKPAKGMYTYFYADFDGKNLWIMNDWFFNGNNIDPDCYNQFGAWTGGGKDRWDIRAYGDQHVEVRKNGQLLDTKTSGVEGGAGYAASPNVKEPHTIYELKIPADPGTWGLQLHDPGPTFSCSHRAGDPSNLSGSLAGGAQVSSTVGTVVVNAPPAPVLTAPDDATSNVALAPTLSWTGVSDPSQFVGYQVQVSTNANFIGDVRAYATANTNYTLPKGALLGGTLYHWRVIAWNYSGSTPSTTSRAFTTLPVSTPDQALLTASYTGQGSLTSEPSGVNCGPTCSAPFALGSSVTLTARAAQGFVFDGWTGDCKANATGDNANVSTVVLDRAKSCAAAFKATTTATFNLVVSKSGNGTVLSQPTGITCGSDCSEAYASGAQITLSATPDAGWAFNSWEGNCTGTNATVTVTMSANEACTAIFQQKTTQTYNLAVALPSNGAGQVTSSPQGISCVASGNGVVGGTCIAPFPINAAVQLTAVAQLGGTFGGWTGDCASQGTLSPITVQMNGARNCGALFAAQPKTQLTVAITSANAGSGSVVSSPAGINLFSGTVSSSFATGSTVRLTATPNAGSTFTGWTGACAAFCASDAGASCTSPAIDIVMPATQTNCTATFTGPASYLLTAGTSGSTLASISSNPAGISCGNAGSACSASFPVNTAVQLTAKADAATHFVAWQGTGCSGSANPVTVAMSSAKTCYASFAANTAIFTYTKAGAGTGSVTISPPGTSCGGSCQVSVNVGANVTATAQPTAGSVFAGWSGDAVCVAAGQANPLSFTANANVACTATFAIVANALTVTKTGTGSGVVTSDVGGIGCGATCTANIAVGTQVTLTAAPDAGSLFQGWTGNGCVAVAGVPTQAKVTLDQARNCSAAFKRVYKLTVTKSGAGAQVGTIASFPAGISCGATCANTFNPNATVNLAATPAQAGQTVTWSGACTADLANDPSGNTAVVAVSSDNLTCDAAFP